MKNSKSKNEKVIRNLALLICSCGIIICVNLAYVKYIWGLNALPPFPRYIIMISIVVTIVAIIITLCLIDWKEFGRDLKKIIKSNSPKQSIPPIMPDEKDPKIKKEYPELLERVDKGNVSSSPTPVKMPPNQNKGNR